MSVLGNKPLPSVVKIAETVHTPKKTSNGYLTTLAAVWTQLVLNDISKPVSFAGTFLINFH